MSDQDRPVAKLFGALLMAVGVLIAGLAGLCSAGFLVMVLSQPGSASGALTGIPMILIFGGVPIAIGIGVFIGGRELWRGPSRPSPRADPKSFD